MKTFNDIQVGDVLVKLFYDATHCTYSPQQVTVTKIKKNEIETKNVETEVIDFIVISDWNCAVTCYNYYDSNDVEYVFTDATVARNFLISTRDNFIENINKTLNVI